MIENRYAKAERKRGKTGEAARLPLKLILATNGARKSRLPTPIHFPKNPACWFQVQTAQVCIDSNASTSSFTVLFRVDSSFKLRTLDGIVAEFVQSVLNRFLLDFSSKVIMAHLTRLTCASKMGGNTGIFMLIGNDDYITRWKVDSHSCRVSCPRIQLLLEATVVISYRPSFDQNGYHINSTQPDLYASSWLLLCGLICKRRVVRVIRSRCCHTMREYFIHIIAFNDVVI
jgi:hypothetical protein